MDITNTVIACAARILQVPATCLSLESNAENIETWDSLNHMKLILALEAELGVTFSDDEVVEITSIEALIATVEGYSNG